MVYRTLKFEQNKKFEISLQYLFRYCILAKKDFEKNSMESEITGGLVSLLYQFSLKLDEVNLLLHSEISLGRDTS